ncbi:MAG: motility associated factor glycosyltransferase family protein [Verrucomicrobia bacterium]|nr:motility associated factor glycosyltransferase family protein [Verrucomicrobiota bacterium]
MSCFEENLRLLQRNSPILAALLGREKRGVAASKETFEEAQRWFQGLKLDQVWVLYVFGIGKGHLYQAAKKWLGALPGRYLVFLEQHVEPLIAFLSEEEAGELLRDKRVRIELAGGLGPLAERYAPLPYLVSTSPHYRGDPQLPLELNISAEHAQIIAYQVLHPNATFYQLFYPAFAKMEGHLDGASLFGKFEKVPALICGAGPSLDKQIEQLRALKGRALIFAGGSALTALTRRGFLPHFGAGLSPHSDEISRFHLQNGFEIPFLWKIRINLEALAFIHGPKLYQRMGEPSVRLLEHLVAIPQASAIQEGPSITYYLTDLALKMGCSPLVYVGVDLAYTQGITYAQGVLTPTPGEGELTVPDIYGKPVATLFKWLHESQVIGEMAQEGIAYNCTEGGIGLSGVENRPLKEMQFPFFADLEGRIHSELIRSDLHLTHQKLDAALATLEASVARCGLLFQQMSQVLGEVQEELKRRSLQLVEAMKKSFSLARAADAKEEDPPPWLLDARLALLTIDLEEEIAYESVFAPMIASRRFYHQRIYEEFVGVIGDDYLLFRWQRQLAIEQEIMLFLQRAAADNRELLSDARAIG